ncbi:MAG: DUF1549 domain-containing protein [Akkermansiaceae bacterium]|nr:DUF1549 domain-containing protein [Akkermansiaceae bacterium]
MMNRKILCAFLLGGIAAPLAAQSTKDLKTPAALKKAAYNVDKYVAEIFRRKKLAVPKVVDDPTFLRRSFLVAAGRIPTLEEASSFLEIDDPAKREMLTQYLLQSDGYRSHMQNYVFDLLRAKDNNRNGAESYAAPYMNFVQQSVAKNTPWDQFAHSLVSAKGIAWEDGNGAVGYYIRDKGMPLDNLALTMQIFTGERLECAQCHDSPTNKWERMDFYELAAFTHGQREINDGVWNRAMRSYNDEDFRRSDIGRLFYWLRDNIHYGTIADQGAGRIKLPSDYQYKDGDPGEMIGGRTHFGKKIRSSDRRDSGKSRIEFSDWMTKENPNFDYIVVNRMWERVMGSPLTYPVDVYVKPEKTASSPLTNYLTRLMVDLDYDLRAFQNVLFLTKTFQFAANPKAFDAGVPQAFNGRQLERMSAEQIWDSLVTLVAEKPDNLAKRKFSNNIYYNNKPILVGEKTMSDLAKEVVAIEDPKIYREYAEALLEKIKSGGGGSSASKDMMMMAAKSRPGPAKGIARASELSAPAPAGHFLREFGQSDRELIESSTKEANVAQILEIMNGHVEKMVVANSGASVYDALKKGTTEADKTRYIYYAILSRPPSQPEMNMLMRDVIDGSKESYENLVAALVQTHEFMFVQ